MERTGFRFGIIRAALAEQGNVLTVTELCEMAVVSRSGYYGWLKAEQVRQDREEQDRADFQLILDAYRFRGYDKGVRGIHMRLLHTGVRMNPKKIRRLMRKYELFCPIRKANPYRRLQKAIRTNNTAENLVNREFETHGPRSILLTDITYTPLNGAHCYLSTVLDACTKQVLSYTLSRSPYGSEPGSYRKAENKPPQKVQKAKEIPSVSKETEGIVAQREGFEPSWDCSQTDFESAPL